MNGKHFLPDIEAIDDTSKSILIIRNLFIHEYMLNIAENKIENTVKKTENVANNWKKRRK